MKRFFFLFLLSLVGMSFVVAQESHYQYETVPDDPFGVKIYTLENGLKIYMSVYKDEPRIQTQIVVRAGSKNDPPQTTGLAHYLEHLMFKGTESFGTTDWGKEKELLEQIEQEFEIYRAENDSEKRKAIYARIDSLSYVASGYAIPNEYVKLMKLIGSTGTNAWTSNDNTVYLENIPSNQLENWAFIQSERFRHPVIRLFHTELETVYEEKNRSLSSDSRKANETMLRCLFPNHPYGTQTTLGDAEQLKNPSITNIKKFIDTYYVPNNMAIILAGDFDPDEAVRVIEKNFSAMAAHELPDRLQLDSPTDLTPDRANTPIMRTADQGMIEVVGQEAEFINVAFPVGIPANSPQIYLLKMLDFILSNGKCGLIDVNINQRQLAVSASSYPYILCDNSAYILTAKPKTGQNIMQLKDLLILQLQMVRQGDFDDALIPAAINNLKLQEMRQLESNRSRASVMANAYMNGIPWKFVCLQTSQYERLTKEDIQKFAGKLLDSGQPVVIYKKQGTPEPVETVVKPPITPIQINRDTTSEFYRKIAMNPVDSIQPVFVDYSTAIQRGKVGKIETYCVKNTENETFHLQLVYPAGELTNSKLPIAAGYLPLIGDDRYSPEKLHAEFYNLACDFSIHCGDEETVLTLSGLSANFEKALDLMGHFIHHAVPDDKIYKEFVLNRIKMMEDAKGSQDKVLSALRVYVEYGRELVDYSLKPEDLKDMNAEAVVGVFTDILRLQPQIRYYGPLEAKKLGKIFKKHYELPKEFATPRQCKSFPHQEVSESQVFYVPYEAKQARLVTYAPGPKFDKELLPIVSLYNSYFGGGMNAIVFQEMREKRSLAYTAQSSYILPSLQNDIMYNYSFIGTQNDKVIDAWCAFNKLFDTIPESETAFILAKNNLKTSIATARITKRSILSSYFSNKKRGIDVDYRKFVYENVDGLTLEDVVRFNHEYIQGKPKSYMLLESKKDVDINQLEKKFGPVKRLELKDIFGY